MRGRDRCTLLIHPDDARRLGLAAGERRRSPPVQALDELSGNAAFSGVPVRIERAAASG